MSGDPFLYCDVTNSEVFKKLNVPKQTIKPNFDLEQINGNIIRGKDLFYLGNGVNSSVWKYQSDSGVSAVKIYFDDRKDFSLEPATYYKMRYLSFKNTLKAFNLLKIKDRRENTDYGYDAYQMQLLNEERNSSILEMSISLLLKNIGNLEDDLELLTKNRIGMQDCKRDNILFNREDHLFYISDIDMFYPCYDLSIDDLRSSNYSQLKFGLYSLFIHELRESFDDFDGLMYNLFLDELSSNEHITDRLESLFGSYDTPKHFFKEYRKK